MCAAFYTIEFALKTYQAAGVLMTFFVCQNYVSVHTYDGTPFSRSVCGSPRWDNSLAPYFYSGRAAFARQSSVRIVPPRMCMCKLSSTSASEGSNESFVVSGYERT